MLIGVIVSGMVEEYTINLCSGIETSAAEDGVNCVIIPGKYIDMNYEMDLKNKYGYCFNSSFSYGMLSCFDGLIVEMASVTMYTTDEKKAEYAERFNHVPHIFVSYNKSGYSSVSIDNKAGLQEALEYTYQCGARTYAMLGGPDHNTDAVTRKECFEEFVRRNHIPYTEKAYVEGSFFLDCTKEAEQLVRDNLDVDVYVCANDILAKRIYGACKKYGRTPGKDVSVIGFDDSDFCVSTYPTISSVRTDIVELGKESYRLLKEVMDGQPVRKTAVLTEFVLRDSVCHRDDNRKLIKNPHDEFRGVLKANAPVMDYRKLDLFEKDFHQMFHLLDISQKDNMKEILDQINEIIENMLSSGCMQYVDWELFVNYSEKKYSAWMERIEDDDQRFDAVKFYAEYLKKILKISQTWDENRGNTDMDSVYEMETFFRETMQFVGSTEFNYARFLNNLAFLGIKNAFLYLYDTPESYMKGESFVIPDIINLQAMVKNGEVYNVPVSQQRIAKEDIFDNEVLDWEGYSKLVVFPIYSESYLYGIICCDMTRAGFGMSEMFTNQISTAVRMLHLRKENNDIVNEYEESVRKLKEYNITLDNMSKTDSLTGLNNRRGFYVRVEKLFDYCPNNKLSMMIGYADMNDLKIVNDRFGHDDGDFALKSIGNILTDYVTMNNGFAARIGGDEFAFVMPITKGEDGNQYRQELYQQFVEFNEHSIKPYNVTVAIGYRVIDEDNIIPIDEALHDADEMLYVEKYENKGDILREVNKTY